MAKRRVQVEAIVVARFCLCVSDAQTRIHTHRQIERESEAGDLRRSCSCETTLMFVAVTGMFLWNYLNVRGNYWNIHWNYLNVAGDCRDVPGNISLGCATEIVSYFPCKV